MKNWAKFLIGRDNGKKIIRRITAKKN